MAGSGSERKRTEKLQDIAGNGKQQTFERTKAAEAEGGAIPRKKREAKAARPMPLPISEGSPAEPGDSPGGSKRETDGIAIFRKSSRWGPASAAMPKLGDPRGRDSKPKGFPSNSLRLVDGNRISVRRPRTRKVGAGGNASPHYFWGLSPSLPKNSRWFGPMARRARRAHPPGQASQPLRCRSSSISPVRPGPQSFRPPPGS